MPSLDTNCSVHSSTSTVSQTSTTEYEHEPFEQYVSKVQQLCHTIWPSVTDGFTIERLRGGSFNRIIGISTPSTADGDGKSYILRIPRFDGGKQEQELAIHQYIGKHTSIPVADIIYSDATENNFIGSPYVVQSRLAGTNMFDSYRSLSHEQQKAVAKEFGTILLDLQTVKNKISGVLESSTSENGDYKVSQFPIEPMPEIKPDMQMPAETASVCDTYLTILKLQEASLRQHFPRAGYKAGFYKRLATVAQQMDEAGLFKDIPNSLCHLDLMPRNLMVDTRSDNNCSDNSTIISGVLDWDSAVFAPVFISCTPPSWLWNWAEDEDEDEVRANDTPETPEMQELKRVFEETVGPQFLIYSYKPEYQLARRLFDLALNGIDTNEALDEAERLIKEWRTMKVNFGLTDDGDDLDEGLEDSYITEDDYDSVSDDGDYSDLEDGVGQQQLITPTLEEIAACLAETHVDAESL